MNSKSNTFWREFVRPLFRRPTRVQVAALCFRDDPEGKSILLITSRDSGRWIIPKGWPINGKNGPESALEEAWEEAGVVKADIDATPIGQYEYLKRLDAGMQTKVRTQVYRAKVKELADDYPEAAERDRRWVSPSVAAGMVAEPQLRDILNAF
jgi:8-oxo-dGTP pyrophosphatase MutT (NUDIX family)